MRVVTGGHPCLGPGDLQGQTGVDTAVFAARERRAAAGARKIAKSMKTLANVLLNHWMSALTGDIEG